MERFCKIAAATLIVMLFLSAAALAQVDRTSLTNKVMVGYQGWHMCPGDGNDSSIGWNHWSESNTYIGPNYYHCEIWPDVSEYSGSDLFSVPNTTLTYGGNPYLYSDVHQGSTNTHWRWMMENGIDGAFVQRFLVRCIGNPNDPLQHMTDTVLQNELNAANTYGRVICLEYDISGVTDANLYTQLTSDWSYLKSTFNLTNNSRYLYHNSKPVVIIWGLGYNDRPGDPTTATNIANYFKNDGEFVMVGVPGAWRTLGPPCKTDPGWTNAFKAFNGITPWSVGGYVDWNGINSWKTTYVTPDISYCNTNGLFYMTTAWPRFGWDNMNHTTCGSSHISSRGGQHLWDQIYAWKSAGVSAQFIAMMDEYDESTAIMKLTDNVPTSGCWWTTEGMGNDWWLRLANQGSRMQKGQITLSQTIPITSGTSPDNSQFISDTIPTTMNPSQQYNVSVTMKNTGETTWSWELFKLGAVGDSDPFASTRQNLPVGTSVAPNSQYTFNFTMTAPSTPGTYTTDWQMVHDIVRWFGAVDTKTVQVGSDTTAPTFGGSINPSTTGNLTPTITITAQDTQSGLNVGSSEFAYSVDSGTSFGTYIGRYVLHSKGTGSGGGNRYWYPDFYHPSYTIASGDHLQYDIYSNNTDGSGSVDLEGSLGNLRDSGILDQNGLSGHPGTNLYSRDYHQWYHRDFNLTSKAGQTITDYEMGHETDSGVSEFYVRNVIITNNGLVKDKAANADAWTAVSDTIGPGTSGYGTLVGPEMLTGDPSSPAACTGSNGTTAVQNVTAAFSSTGMSPLVTGSNNRIKYRISDMNANRATSSTFTLTINGESPYAGVISLPGTIQAENYDIGGQNVSYYDTTSGNAGGQYRSDDVDIEATTDTGGGYDVGWTANGEWLNYTVNVASAGYYDIYLRMADNNGSGSVKFLIDGTDVTGTRSFAGTGGNQNWTTIVLPACSLTAGQHILQLNIPTGGWNCNKVDVISRGTSAVSIDMGNPDINNGITNISTGDGNTTPWTAAGHNFRENVSTSDLYMYFNVSDSWAYQGNKPNVYITFDYYDKGTGTLGLNYDSTSNTWAYVAGPTLTNTLTFKQYTFHVTDAYFGNRENYGADFRICGVAAEWGVDTVVVNQ